MKVFGDEQIFSFYKNKLFNSSFFLPMKYFI